MNRGDRLNIVWVHGWLGVVLGALLFFMAFTGGAALFAEKLLYEWFHPEIAELDLQDPTLLGAVQDVAFDAGPSGMHELVIRPPGELHERHFSAMFELDKSSKRPDLDSVEVLVNPLTLVADEVRSGKRSDFLVDRWAGSAMLLQRLHTSLRLPTSIGEKLIVIAALAMFLLATTGLLLQPNIVAELFRRPIRRQTAALWRSLHKLAGAWVFVFLLFMSFSASFFAVALPYLANPVAEIAFEGDRDAIRRELLVAPKGLAIKPPGERPALAAAVSTALDRAPSVHLTRYTISDLDQNTGVIGLRASLLGHLCGYGYGFDAWSGAILSEGCTFNLRPAPLSAVVNALLPLHTNHSGGPVLAVAWSVLAMLSALGIWVGVAYWFEKRAMTSRDGATANRYRVLGRITNSLCASVILGVLLVVVVDLVGRALGLHVGYQQLSIVFWSLVLLVTLGSAMASLGKWVSGTWLLYASAVLCLMVVLLRAGLYGVAGGASVLVPAVFLALAAGLWQMPRIFPQPQQLTSRGVSDA